MVVFSQSQTLNYLTCKFQVWQEKASIIVMLCQLVEEKNKKKADLYWPLEPRQKPVKNRNLFNIQSTTFLDQTGRPGP
jgi:protein tyrosine phosphatase